MIPINLKISGFLSYRDTVILDFRGFDLACISGENGAGKSSLLDAITWVLFGLARKRDDSLINTHEDVKFANVIYDFAYEGNVYRVNRMLPRGKVTSLDFFIFAGKGEKTTLERIQEIYSYSEEEIVWKPLTERTMRDTQHRIEDILRMDYETFVNASFFLQGRADTFTQQKPADRKRILSNILGLEIWEQYRKKAIEKRKSIELKIENIIGGIGEIDSELKEEEKRHQRLNEIQVRLIELEKLRKHQERLVEDCHKIVAALNEQRILVQALSKQRDSSERNLNDLQKRMEILIAQKQNYHQVLSRKQEIEDQYMQWKQLLTRLHELDRLAERFRETEKQRQEPLDEINSERARLSQEQKNLEMRYKEILENAKQLPNLQQQINNIKEELDQADQLLIQRKELDEENNRLNQQIAEATAENTQLKQMMDEIKSRIDQLEVSEKPECPVCGQSLSRNKRQALLDQLAQQGKDLAVKYRDNREFIKQTDQKIADLKAQLKLLVNVEKNRVNNTDALARVQTTVEQINKLQSDWEESTAIQLQQIQRSLTEEDFCTAARNHLAKIDQELIQIGYDPALHITLRQEEERLQNIETEYLDLHKAQTSINVVDDEVTNLSKQITSLQMELKNQVDAYDQAAKRLAEVESNAPDIDLVEREMLAIQEQENQQRSTFGAAKQQVDVLVELKARRERLSMDRVNKEIFVAKYKQLERAFSKDGVPALLIEQALPQIEGRANELLERLSGGDMSIKFITQAEYKDKNREDFRETLDICISDSVGTRDYEMYSGGEAFRINFAIRLALSEVLAQRAGAKLQTLVIDEGFGSQDARGRQKLIEAINLVRKDFSKILVITHMDELKEAFPVRIDVEKTIRGSQLKVI